jgi:hypothetical protein
MVRTSQPASLAAIAIGAAGLIAAAVLLSQTAALPQLPAAHHAAAAQPANSAASVSGQTIAQPPRPAPAGTTLRVRPAVQPVKPAQPVDRCTSLGAGSGRVMPMCPPALPQP